MGTGCIKCRNVVSFDGIDFGKKKIVISNSMRNGISDPLFKPRLIDLFVCQPEINVFFVLNSS